MRHPDVPADLRGTYAGLAHESVLEYLTGLGATAVELLPVHHYVPEEFLLKRGGYRAAATGARAIPAPRPRPPLAGNGPAVPHVPFVPYAPPRHPDPALRPPRKRQRCYIGAAPAAPMLHRCR